MEAEKIPCLGSLWHLDFTWLMTVGENKNVILRFRIPQKKVSLCTSVSTAQCNLTSTAPYPPKATTFHPPSLKSKQNANVQPPASSPSAQYTPRRINGAQSPCPDPDPANPPRSALSHPTTQATWLNPSISIPNDDNRTAGLSVAPARLLHHPIPMLVSPMVDQRLRHPGQVLA